MAVAVNVRVPGDSVGEPDKLADGGLLNVMDGDSVGIIDADGAVLATSELVLELVVDVVEIKKLGNLNSAIGEVVASEGDVVAVLVDEGQSEGCTDRVPDVDALCDKLGDTIGDMVGLTVSSAVQETSLI